REVSMRITKTLALGAIGAVAGCAGAADGSSPGGDISPPVQKTDPSAAVAHIDDNLARLRALSVVDVGQLVLDLPQEAFSCYGPCPGWEAKIAKAKEASAVRLDKLTPIAEAAAKTPVADACAKTTIDENIAALSALKIVAVGGLIKQEPKNNP